MTKNKINKEYYIAVDLKAMEAQIFTTITKASEYLNVSSKTLSRGLSDDWRVFKKNKYLVCRTSITKLKNRGNIENLRRYMIGN